MPEIQPLSILNVFPTYDRAGYFKQFKVHAPKFDPTKRVKTWFDPNPKELNTYTTLKIGNLGQPIYEEFTMTAEEAASVNLPGPYPAYDPKPELGMTATLEGPFGYDNKPVDAGKISHRAEADEFAAQFGMTVISVADAFPMIKFKGGNDQWNWWMVVDGVYKWTAADFIDLKRAKGVGFPGKFVKSAEGIIRFVETVSPVSLSEAPMPVRKLKSDEKLTVPPMGNPFIVVGASDPMPGSGAIDVAPIVARISALEEKIDHLIFLITLGAK